LRYLQEYQKAGIFIDYLCLFNEPGIYTKIPYSKIRDLIKNHVGPLLAKEGIKTKIMLSEAESREQAARRYPVVLDDPEARKYVGAMPYHGYDFGHFDKIAALHERYPDLPLWMTEVCYAYQAGTPKTMKLPRPDFEDGDFWGNQIFSDLEAGAAAWIYWNMILDEQGGPWAVSPVHGNPDDNIQHPLVIINRKNHEVIYTGAFYYLAHFAKFVRPGAVRVEVKGTNRTPVRCIAFQTADGQAIAQLMNSGDKEIAARLDVQGQSLQLDLPAGSITTAMWKKR
jgi:glucosylceramidase